METVDEAAKRLGLRSYDTALPQEWVDDFKAKTGVYPAASGLFVWCYDGAGIFGRPVALSERAEVLLAQYQAATKR
jgi:hypothetical protein